VLNQLIDSTIAKDREFVAWRTEHPQDTVAKPNGHGRSGTVRAPVEAHR
jgi:hypothetical protein